MKTKAYQFLLKPRLLYVHFALNKLRNNAKSFDDRSFITRMFKIKIGKKLDLDNVVLFNEKMQWLKLFNRKQVYTTMVDKHAVKKYVSDIVGNEYVIKELGAWDHYYDIDFEALPNQFVLKTTHGCGDMLIVKDKNKCDFSKYNSSFETSLSKSYYYVAREWPYKDVPPKIIAEELIVDQNYEHLPVYKFFCFDGEPYICQVIQNDKQRNETIDYFDMDYNKLKLRQNYPNSKKPLPKPEKYKEMQELCRQLTKGIPFVRCDLYYANNKILFSEFTFFSDAGFEPFHPKKWDLVLGEKIKLDK